MNQVLDTDLELDVLQHISQNDGAVRQRDLATVIGKSLGMTNAILHRLTEKGWLVLSKVNNRNISYAVTPHGMRALAGRSYRYFKRTVKNVVDFKDTIEAELCRILQDNAARLSPGTPRTLVLVGPSDLDFILEHLAHKYHLGWAVLPAQAGLADIPLEPGVILVWPEDSESAELAGDHPVIRLRSLICA